MATATVRGIGPYQSGAGYVRMLNHLWAGRPNLTRVQFMPAIWAGAGADLDLRAQLIEWTEGEVDLRWTDGGADLLWSDGDHALTSYPTSVDGWFGLYISGFPPSTIVARPSERITVRDLSGSESGFVLGVVHSNSNGEAFVPTSRSSGFTISGMVSIGDSEEIVFEALGVPEAVQGLSDDFYFQWNFREVFEDEYPGGFTDVVPPWV
jgi:hypothetical protein